MSLNIVELFGFSPTDQSAEAQDLRRSKTCPFLRGPCTKTFRDGERAGVCSVKQSNSGIIICCPNRMYAHNYRILSNIAEIAFQGSHALFPGRQAMDKNEGRGAIAVFGKGWGHELRLPGRGRSGGYFVDWILAHISKEGELMEFVAVEVQTVDTTGTYREERDPHMRGQAFAGKSKAGLNWENVSKRILPQIIYKGHVLRREELCHKGLFFVCPTPVYDKISERLGGNLLQYSFQPGALTFMWYGLADKEERHELVKDGELVTTVDQVAHAFTSPSNLPEAGVYETAIRKALDT